jgi:hypothetical protein
LIRAILLSIACGLRIIFGMFPVNLRRLRKHVLVTTTGLVASLSVVGLLVTVGCNTTVQTEHASADQSLRSRRVKGPSSEIFEVAARCIRQEFPDGQIYSDPTMGQISVTDYSIARGDAVLEVLASGRPDGMVDVTASATGLGGDRMRAAIERFLNDFDQAYDEWVRQQVSRPQGIE